MNLTDRQYQASNLPPVQPPAAMPPQAPKPKGWGKMWAAFGFGALLMFIYIAAQVAGSFHVLGLGIDANAILAGCEMAAGAVGILFIVALGGTTIAKPRVQGMAVAWKAAAWLFFISGLLVLMDILSIAYGQDSLNIASDWPVRVLVLAVLCLGVGMFEEGLIRGLCLNGLLARMGTSRKGTHVAVILSALAFGLIHFDFLIDFADPLQVAQNLMKVVQTGMVGYLLAAIVVYTRNLWAPILIHAANDFLLMFMIYGLENQEISTTYVSTGEEGVAALVLLVIISLLYIPLIVFGAKMLKRTGAWRGDFYHYDDPSQPATAAAPVAVPGYYSIPFVRPVQQPGALSQTGQPAPAPIQPWGPQLVNRQPKPVASPCQETRPANLQQRHATIIEIPAHSAEEQSASSQAQGTNEVASDIGTAPLPPVPRGPSKD